mmetsp:Transcript_7681/g.16759  ORF Transcript_7681/g.16759 Transcript_7681/m.16759 type:complete len:91 (-) Transcript_7681:401-673(-)
MHAPAGTGSAMGFDPSPGIGEMPATGCAAAHIGVILRYPAQRETTGQKSQRAVLVVSRMLIPLHPQLHDRSTPHSILDFVKLRGVVHGQD